MVAAKRLLPAAGVRSAVLLQLLLQRSFLLAETLAGIRAAHRWQQHEED